MTYQANRTIVIGLLAALSFAMSAAFAQTATKPDGEWRGSVGLGATLASGNTKSTNVNINADAVRQTAMDKLGFYAQSLYGNSTIGGSSITTAQMIRLGGRYDRNLTNEWFVFGALDLEKNKPADVKWRIVPAGGVGYHVIKTDVTTFDVFGGLAYNSIHRYSGQENSGLELVVGEESTHKLSATSVFRQKFVVYPSLKDRGEFRSTFDAGIVTAVAGGWSLTVSLADRFDSNPPTGVKKNDILLFTGLQYGFGPSAK